MPVVRSPAIHPRKTRVELADHRCTQPVWRLVLRTGNTVSTESVTAPWSLGARSERTRRVRERRV